MFLLEENTSSIFQNTLTIFTRQLLQRHNSKRYSSDYPKNLFCEALEIKPTLFKEIRPRRDIICKYTSAISFRPILRESVVFQ